MAIRFSVVTSVDWPRVGDEILFYELHRMCQSNTEHFDRDFPNHCLNGTVPLVDYAQYAHDVTTGISHEQQQFCYEVMGPLVNNALQPLRKGIFAWIAALNTVPTWDVELPERDCDLVMDNIYCVSTHFEEPWVFAELVFDKLERVQSDRLRWTFKLDLTIKDKFVPPPNEET